MLFLEEDGLLVRGDLQSVDAVLEQLLQPAEVEAHRRAASRVADITATGASVASVAATAQEYLRLTPESLAKVKQYGAQNDGTGALLAYVRGDRGKIAGQLKFENVSFGPEQALAMQTAAVSMALRSAIADVQAAVERVEDKVSDIQRRLGARQLGDVVGSYRRLSRVVEATSARGELLDADWDSVAGAGLGLERDLETMRAYVTKTVDDIDAHARLPKRETAVKRLSDPNGVTGTLRLILVAEQALHLWEYLRIERIRRTQPEHLESALDEARASLASHRARDEELLRTTTERIKRARKIDPLEILHVLAIPDMEKASNRALDELGEFARAARAPLPVAGRHIRRPELSETGAELKRQALDAKDGVVQVTRSAGQATARGAKSAGHRVGRSLRR